MAHLAPAHTLKGLTVNHGDKFSAWALKGLIDSHTALEQLTFTLSTVPDAGLLSVRAPH